jgi:hypothetical protein
VFVTPIIRSLFHTAHPASVPRLVGLSTVPRLYPAFCETLHFVAWHGAFTASPHFIIARIVCNQIYCSKDDQNAFLETIKTQPCPHCKSVGYLIRHGYLRGYDQMRSKSIRASRVFCSNRNRAMGCGKTFSVWIADKVKRLFLSAECLFAFLNDAAKSGNKVQAFRKLNCSLSDSAPYRIWKRFILAQSRIRTALTWLSEPPRIESNSPTTLTLAHLREAVKQHPLSPIAAFHVTLRIFFV